MCSHSGRIAITDVEAEDIALDTALLPAGNPIKLDNLRVDEVPQALESAFSHLDLFDSFAQRGGTDSVRISGINVKLADTANGPVSLVIDDLVFARPTDHSLQLTGEIAINGQPATLDVQAERLGDKTQRFTAKLSHAEFAATYTPAVLGKLTHYTGERPLFDLYNVETEIERALSRRVDLKSGGYLMIDQTEAMTTIDVNTGGYVGARNFDDTIFKTNLEAALMIARQLRLRNLGGIIIIDFIDMESAEHRDSVLAELKKALARDRTRITVNGFSQLGLVEMTRKRTRESLAHVLCEPCAVCQGKGQVKTPRTLCYDILREILRESRQFNPREFRLIASQEVVDLFLEEESQHLAMLIDFIGKPISLQVESTFHQEQYDIILM